MDGASDSLGYHCWGGGIELAVEVQEREAVDERPDRRGERVGVGLQEGSLDDRTCVRYVAIGATYTCSTVDASSGRDVATA